MNPKLIKNKLENYLNKEVEITVYGMRNKKTTYKGILKNLYPSIFTIAIDNYEKSFSYANIITGDTEIKYK